MNSLTSDGFHTHFGPSTTLLSPEALANAKGNALPKSKVILPGLGGLIVQQSRESAEAVKAKVRILFPLLLLSPLFRLT